MTKAETTVERVGGYRVVRRLATGGTSDVLLAKAEGPLGFERTVVLKRLLSHFQGDDEFARMFAREASAYARLSHPSIVRLFDFFAIPPPGQNEGDRIAGATSVLSSREGQLVMVLEYVDGPALSRLRSLLKAIGKEIEDEAAIYIAARIFSALAAAHAAVDEAGAPSPVIHRDVNPSNVLVPWDGDVKLADFGVAKVSGLTHQSVAGMIKGTYGYMAPEQVTGDAVTPRADVYAGAIILWELLTKRRAFHRGALPEVEALRAMAEPRLLSIDTTRPDVSKAVRDALKRALEPRPARRTITAEEMVSILLSSVTAEEGQNKLVDILNVVKSDPRVSLHAEAQATEPSMRPPSLRPPNTAPMPLTVQAAVAPPPTAVRAPPPPSSGRTALPRVQVAAAPPSVPRATASYTAPAGAKVPSRPAAAVSFQQTAPLAPRVGTRTAALPTSTLRSAGGDSPPADPAPPAPLRHDTITSNLGIRNAINDALRGQTSAPPPAIEELTDGPTAKAARPPLPPGALGRIPPAPSAYGPTPAAPDDPPELASMIEPTPAEPFVPTGRTEPFARTVAMEGRPTENPGAVAEAAPPPPRTGPMPAYVKSAPVLEPFPPPDPVAAEAPTVPVAPVPVLASVVPPARSSVPDHAAVPPVRRRARAPVVLFVVFVLALGLAAGAVVYVRFPRAATLHPPASSPEIVATTSTSSAPLAASALSASSTPTASAAPLPSDENVETNAPAASRTAAAVATAPAEPDAGRAGSMGDSDLGIVKTAGAAPGRRIFVDERTVGQTPESVTVKCGPHAIRVGSSGKTQTVDVPCGGEIVVGDKF